jgi:hypothetical protein
VRTVRRWIAEEILPSVKVCGTRLVTRKAVERLLSPTRLGWAESRNFTRNSGLGGLREIS